MNFHANPVCEISAKEKAVRMGGFICFNFEKEGFNTAMSLSLLSSFLINY